MWTGSFGEARQVRLFGGVRIRRRDDELSFGWTVVWDPGVQCQWTGHVNKVIAF